MKRISLLIGFFLTLTTAMAQTSFVRTLGGKDKENNYAIKRTPEGGYITAGYTESYGSGKKDALLVKTNGLGQILWSKAYGGSGDDVAWDVTVSPDSGYVFVGTTNSNPSSNANALIVKTDKDGVIDWSMVLDNDSTEDAYKVITGAKGDYYLTGFVRTDTTGDDAFVAKITSSGSLAWYKHYGSPGTEEAYSLAEDRNGNIVFCGSTTYDSITNGGTSGSSGNSDIFIGKVTSKGDLSYMRTYGTTESENGWDVTVNGDVYAVTGWVDLGGGDRDVVVYLTDTASKLTASQQFGGFGDDRAFNILPRSSSKFALTGYSDVTGSDRDAFLLTIDDKLITENLSLYGNTGRDGHWPTDVVQNGDGGYTVLTTSNSYKSSNGDDWMLIRTDDQVISECEGRLEIFNESPVSGTASKNFGVANNLFNNSSISLKTTNISSMPDSTICCQLYANVSRSSYTVCEGEFVSLGGGAIDGYSYSWTASSGNFKSSDANPRIAATQDNTYKLVVTAKDSKCKSDSATVRVTVTQKRDLGFVNDTAFCEGDSAYIKIYGGLASYSWSGGHISSSDSFITVSETDTIYFSGLDQNSCLYSDTLISTANPLPVFNLGADTTICENSPIILQGPANMASYSWNEGEGTMRTFTTNKEQTHTLDIVDSNGCEASDEIQLLIDPASSFDLGPDTAFCEGGSYLIIGPGALGGYIWNDTASTLQNLRVNQPGTYHLTAFNSFDCPASDTITLTWRDRPMIDLGPDVNICQGEQVYLDGPDDMARYLWQNGSGDDSLLVGFSGTYILEITDSFGCQNMDSVDVIVHDNPAITLGNDTTICHTDQLVLDPGAGFNAYDWSTGANTQQISVSEEGTYSVTVTDGFGCEGDATIRVDTTDCTGSIRDLGFESFKYYPSPVKSILHLEMDATEGGALQCTVIDLSGRVAWKEELQLHAGSNSRNLNLSTLPSGMYVLQLQNMRSTSSLRIMIE